MLAMHRVDVVTLPPPEGRTPSRFHGLLAGHRPQTPVPGCATPYMAGLSSHRHARLPRHSREPRLTTLLHRVESGAKREEHMRGIDNT